MVKPYIIGRVASGAIRRHHYFINRYEIYVLQMNTDMFRNQNPTLISFITSHVCNGTGSAYGAPALTPFPRFYHIRDAEFRE